MKSLTLFRSVFVGTTITFLAFVAKPTLAMTLTPVTEAFAFDPANEWTIDATAQGRAGAPGGMDWELGSFDNNIPGGSTTDQAHWTWEDGDKLSWLLEVDRITSLAEFQMWGSNPEISKTINLGTSDGFNGFGIVASSNGWDSKKVAPATEISVTVDNINGNNLGANSFTTDAVAPEAGIDKEVNYFALDETSYSLGGTLFMDWDSLNPQAARARSRVQFEVKIFDRPNETQSVPEPSLLLGLLSIGGVALTKKRG